MSFKNILKDNVAYVILIAFCFVADRLTKTSAIKFLLERNSTYYVNDFINLDLVWNSGIGFGLLDLEANLYYHLITLVIFVIIIILVYFLFRSDKIDKLFYSLIIGGAFGNIYDRILYYSVPDFIDLHFDKFHWFTFNVADIFISIGVIGLIISELLKKNENV